jgi:hypothetical protein
VIFYVPNVLDKFELIYKYPRLNESTEIFTNIQDVYIRIANLTKNIKMEYIIIKKNGNKLF